VLQKISYKIALFSAIIALSIACSPKQFELNTYQAQYLTIKDSIPDWDTMTRFIGIYKGRLDSIMNEPVGSTAVPLTKAQPESTLGNFVADAQLAGGKKLDHQAIISVVNYGGIRIPFVATGVITKGKVYEIMPFDNTLTIVEIPGSVLQQFCDHMAARKGWPISGFSYKIKEGKATEILVNGEALRMQAVYKLVTSDYVANGGDECEFLVPLKKYPSTVFLRDAMITALQQAQASGQSINPTLEKRISYAD
jgi:2',3'-cyclic-nucleotide 2'-phosphodiesterase (5'-nucleotidase family)